MFRAHIIKLDPTHKQEAFFRQCVGTARFAYNWALVRWKQLYAAGGRPFEGQLRKDLNATKRQDFPWMLDVPKRVVEYAIMNLGTAYDNFFTSLKNKRKGRKYNEPQFKKRHGTKQSARLDDGSGTTRFKGKSVRLPKIGWVKTHETLRFNGKLVSAILSFSGGRWWLSATVELPDVSVAAADKPSVGVDLGLKTALVLSDGKTFESPRPLKAALERLKRLSRSVSRKVKGSNNRKKAGQKLARFHWRIAQIRRDWTHKVTTAIAKQYGTIGLEDLNVSGMLTNHKLARAISDVGFYEVRRQLMYKAPVYGGQVVVVNRWLPTSKTCSNCGCVKDVLALSERVFSCSHCGLEIDRDLNAARNIHTASCAGINACGDGSSGTGLASTKLPSVKQESHRAAKAYSDQTEILVRAIVR